MSILTDRTVCMDDTSGFQRHDAGPLRNASGDSVDSLALPADNDILRRFPLVAEVSRSRSIASSRTPRWHQFHSFAIHILCYALSLGGHVGWICTKAFSVCLGASLQGIGRTTQIKQGRALIFLTFLALNVPCVAGTLQSDSDDSIRAHIHQRTELHTLAGPQILATLVRELQLIAGWSAQLAVHSDLEAPAPHSTLVASVFTAGLWQCLCSQPSAIFLEAMHTVQLDLLKCLPLAGVSAYVSVLLTAVTSCVSVCRARSLYLGGRKSRMRAHRLCHSFSPLLQAAFSRPGEASITEALELYQFVYLQARCVQDPRPQVKGEQSVPSSFVYQLGSESLYIGQGAQVRGSSGYSGGVGRLREHLRGLRCVAQGTPTKERSRYLQLAPGCNSWLLLYFLAITPTTQVHALESAHIAYTRPLANNLNNAHLGRLRARYRQHPRARQRRHTRRKFEHSSEAHTALNQTWYDKRISTLCSQRMGFSQYLAARHRWQHLLQHRYGDLYDVLMQQRVQARQGFGPLNLTGSGNTILMLKWASTFPLVIPWELVCKARTNGTDYLYNVWEFTTLYPFWMDRVRVRSSLKSYLHSVKLPTPVSSVVKVSHPSEVTSVKSWLARTVQQARPSRPAWATWAAKSVRIVVRPQLTLRRRLCNVARTFRRQDFQDLARFSLHDFHLAARGEDMERIPMNGRIPLITPTLPQPQRDNTQTSCRRWLSSQGLDKNTYPNYKCRRPRPAPPLPLDGRQYQALGEARQNFENRALEAQEPISFTVEDKDPNTLWRINGLYHLARWLHMIAKAPDRWRVVDTSKAAVVGWYRLLYDYTIPKPLRAKGEGPLNAEHVPYIYPTVKLKCWDGDHLPPVSGRHKCKKPQHSCFRNICSFVRLPSRSLYRSISRAFTFISNQMNPGWSFSSLDTAVPNLLDQYEHLVSAPASGPCLCRGCQTPMTCPGLVVGDAGQAYEAIAVDKIHECLDRLFAKLDASEKEGKRRCVTVMRTRRSHVFFGGSSTRRLWDRTVWYTSSIRRALEGFLGTRLFLVSGLVV